MYTAPLRELDFVLHELLGDVPAGEDSSDYAAELVCALLQEAGKFAVNVLAPINGVGDGEGPTWTAGRVVMPAAYKDAYAQFVANGWPQLRAPIEHGGQGAPFVVSTAIEELWASAALAFKHVSMLSQGAVEALHRCASDEQKRRYLPRLVSGEWTGTMNLTEPQAGSDLGAIRTRAVPESNRYRLFGRKLFISYGEHDLVENIIHLVLARIEGAPAGAKGISLFLVPKRLLNDQDELGAANDIRCLSIEHKLGARGSPTCLLAYGDSGGAIGELIGEPGKGLEYMFVMMNSARLSVGLEGYALTERAYQHALEWARSRVQGVPAYLNTRDATSPLSIAYHPDVTRMLLTMRAGTEAARSLALYAAQLLDTARDAPGERIGVWAQQRADLLIPIVKGWSTEMGIRGTSLGIQIHGGMGFMEETGAAQFFRDARGAALYEGTTGIQANDLVARKLFRDRGAAMAGCIEEMLDEIESVADDRTLESMKCSLRNAIEVLRDATSIVLELMETAPDRAQAVAVAYLELCGTVLGGWLMVRAASLASQHLGAGRDDADFYTAKLQTARFYIDNLLPCALAAGVIVKGGAASVVESNRALL